MVVAGLLQTKKKDFKDSEKEKKMDFNAFVDVNQQ